MFIQVALPGTDTAVSAVSRQGACGAHSFSHISLPSLKNLYNFSLVFFLLAL